MRGIALVMMVVAHTEVMSVFNIFSWERFGLTTGAEGFVILGVYASMLNRARLQKVVLSRFSGALSQGMKIYRVNIIIIVSFILLAYPINVFEVTHFVDRFRVKAGRLSSYAAK